MFVSFLDNVDVLDGLYLKEGMDNLNTCSIILKEYCDRHIKMYTVV